MAETLDSLVFGKPITSNTVAAVERLCDFIQQEDHLLAEGIFRQSGNERRKRDLKSAINKGQDLVITESKIGENGENIEVLIPNAETAGEFRIHDACCVLKSLLNSLPENLMFVQEVIEIVEEDIESNHPDFSIVLIQSLKMFFEKQNVFLINDNRFIFLILK